MRHLLTILFVPLVFILLNISCRHTPPVSLLEAERLITQSPDSALAILESVDGSGWSRDDSMYAALLRVKASDKAYILSKSDSAIVPLLKYYIAGKRHRELHPTVLYYAGRTYSDLLKPDSALKYYKAALRSLPSGEDPDLHASIHSQMGGLYLDNSLYRHSLEHVKQELRYCRMLPDSVQAFNALLSLAFNYRMLNMRDSALIIYRHLEPKVENLGDSIAESEYYTQYASCLIHMGKIAEADSIIKSRKIVWDKATAQSVLLVLNSVDSYNGNDSNLEARLKKILAGPYIDARRFAAGSLGRYCIKKGDYESAVKYLDRYVAVSDSIFYRQSAASLAETEKLLAQSEAENEILRLNNDVNSRNIAILVLILAILLLVLFAIGLVYVFKRIQARKNHEMQELREETERAIRENNAEIELHKEERRRLESQLHSSEERIRMLSLDIPLKEAVDSLLRASTSSKSASVSDKIIRLEMCLSDVEPNFIVSLGKLNLARRDYIDAMLIKVRIPQKVCAAILQTTPNALANARKRLLERHNLSSEYRNWNDFILSL